MSALTIGIIVLVAIVAVVLYVIGNLILETDRGFVWMAFGTLGLIILASIYMSYAVPTFAKPSLKGPARSSATAGYAVEESNLLQE